MHCQRRSASPGILCHLYSNRVRDNLPLTELTGFFLPKGGIQSNSILHNLIECLHFQGQFNKIHQVCEQHPETRWILNATLPSFNPLQLPPGSRGLQSEFMHILNLSNSFHSNPTSAFQSYLLSKLSVTLNSRVEEPILVYNLVDSPNWFHNLLAILNTVNPFIRVCWLRTACGGWTTSIRMHQEVAFSGCFFGCRDCEDSLTHYLQCPSLWSLAREMSQISELSPSLPHRLSLVNPTKEKLVLLAFVHSLYHMCINDKECQDLHFSSDSALLQRRALSFARQLRYQVNLPC